MAEIRTTRLVLRPARPADAPALHAILSDWDVAKMTATWPWPPDPEASARRSVPFDPAKGLAGHIFLGDEMIGAMAVKPSGGRPMLGYNIARAHWGRGYATEMGAALIAACWRLYDWPEIGATVFEENPASMRVLAKLGFAEYERGFGASLARGPGEWPVRRFRLARPALF